MRAWGLGELEGLADQAFAAGRDALRWVSSAGVPGSGGMTWPETLARGAPLVDDLYYGTAGILLALAEARLSDITEFDDHACAAAGRLRGLLKMNLDYFSERKAAAGSRTPDSEPCDLSLYTGLGGMTSALHGWARISGNQAALTQAAQAAGQIAAVALAGDPANRWLDLLQGDAGTLLVAASLGGADGRPAASELADRIAAQAWRIDGLPDWQPHTDARFLMPNFSHGLAGFGYALAASAGPLGRPDLLELAALSGHRLVRLGLRPDGSLAVPEGIPSAAPQEPVSYGWCHGPTGTLQLFRLLDRLRPGEGWARWVQASSAAVRGSGLPVRRYPGFWDNLGQCCGTAGVGEMALDRYQESADPGWLDWAALLARDVLARRTSDADGIRWSHTEHRANPPQTEPALGLMQGAAGIASWLLRLARVIRGGAGAPVVWRPDRPPG